MGEKESNPEVIRRVIKELSNVRKEQRTMRLWGGVLLGGNLLLLAGFLWVSKQEIKQPAPVETTFQYPPAAIPTDEDNSVWIADSVDVVDATTDNNTTADTDTDTADSTDNVNDTGDNSGNTDVYPLESPATPVPTAAPSPVPETPDNAPRQISVARTPHRTVRPRRKKKVTAIPPSIITRPGMTLRSLARRYYGSEVFWIYIYDRNTRVMSSLETSSFDALPSGIRLELPRPADYGIDATEPISLQRACKQAKSLTKQ